MCWLLIVAWTAVQGSTKKPIAGSELLVGCHRTPSMAKVAFLIDLRVVKSWHCRCVEVIVEAAAHTKLNFISEIGFCALSPICQTSAGYVYS